MRGKDETLAHAPAQRLSDQDELLGLQPTKSNGRQPSRKVLRRLEQIENLPRRDQDALLRTIDAFLSKSAA